MIETTCPTCGQKQLLPDPPENIRTPYERMDFERDWDRRVEQAQS